MTTNTDKDKVSAKQTGEKSATHKKTSTTKWPDKITVIIPEGVQMRNPKDDKLVRKVNDKTGEVNLKGEITLDVETTTFWRKLVNTRQVKWKGMPENFELPPAPIKFPMSGK